MDTLPLVQASSLPPESAQVASSQGMSPQGSGPPILRGRRGYRGSLRLPPPLVVQGTCPPSSRASCSSVSHSLVSSGAKMTRHLGACCQEGLWSLHRYSGSSRVGVTAFFPFISALCALSPRPQPQPITTSFLRLTTFPLPASLGNDASVSPVPVKETSAVVLEARSFP